MVEDVLTQVRQVEDKAEEIVKKAKEEATKILDKADSDAQNAISELVNEGNRLAEDKVREAGIAGAKEGEEIIKTEKTKASKLEKSSIKNIDKSVELIIESVLSIGGN